MPCLTPFLKCRRCQARKHRHETFLAGQLYLGIEGVTKGNKKGEMAMEGYENYTTYTDEMLTLEDASARTGVDVASLRLATRAGELRAWVLPMQRGLLV